MKIKEKEIKIAEYLGATWQEVPPMSGEWFESLSPEEKDSVERLHPKRILSFYKYDFDSPNCAPLPFPDPNGDAVNIPAYYHDLNVMREAIKQLTVTQAEELIYTLCKILNFTMSVSWHDYDVFQILSTSPAQQAEAFGITLGLWD